MDRHVQMYIIRKIREYARSGIKMKDSIYDLFVLRDDDGSLRVICPLCGWKSKSPLPTFCDRFEWFSRISSVLARHMISKHKIRLKKMPFPFCMGEATYRCPVCGYTDEGYLWVLMHYIAEHLKP